MAVRADLLRLFDQTLRLFRIYVLSVKPGGDPLEFASDALEFDAFAVQHVGRIAECRFQTTLRHWQSASRAATLSAQQSSSWATRAIFSA